MTGRPTTTPAERSEGNTAGTATLSVSPKGISIAAVAITVIGLWAPNLGVYLMLISVLVAVHEAAHLVVARRCGLACSEYAVGFGPVVASLRTRSMTWSWRAIPAGGFVRIVGPNEASEVPEGIDESETLRGTTPARRVATIAAGPVSNLVAAVLLSVVAFGVVGSPGADGRVRLDPVEASVAAFGDVTRAVEGNLSGLGAVVADADGYAAAVVSGNRDEAPASFLSPLGAAELVDDLDDLHLLLRFAAVLSACLGVFNLLPFPPLDGGHLAVEAINAARSAVRGTKVRTSVRALNYASVATLTFFVVLTLTALRFDLAA